MNRTTYTRAHDGAPVTEDEALNANGILKDGYWMHTSGLLRDSAPSSTTRMFVHDGQDKMTLSDSDRAYYEMIERDQNAWRDLVDQTPTRQADSSQPVVLGDAATAWAKMVENDQNAWRGVQR